jgi:hypothetical protein
MAIKLEHSSLISAVEIDAVILLLLYFDDTLRILVREACLRLSILPYLDGMLVITDARRRMHADM